MVSITTVNGSSSQLVSTRYVTEVALATSQPTSSLLAVLKSSSSFFDSTAKVAGTFTAVGVVVVAALSSILYCCCFGGGRHSDDYSDEENQYSSDELSIGNEKAVGERGLKPSLRASSANLNRNNLSKSILSLFNLGAAAGGAGVSRSTLKKRLNPKGSSNDLSGGPMFPILEFDHRLDPATMFQTNNESKMSLADEQDYSRRILHIANPEER